MRRLAISLCTRAQRAAAQATSTGLGQLAHTGNGTRATGRGLASLLAPVSRELPVAPPSSLAASRTSVPLSLHLQQMSSAVAGCAVLLHSSACTRYFSFRVTLLTFVSDLAGPAPPPLRPRPKRRQTSPPPRARPRVRGGIS